MAVPASVSSSLSYTLMRCAISVITLPPCPASSADPGKQKPICPTRWIPTSKSTSLCRVRYGKSVRVREVVDFYPVLARAVSQLVVDGSRARRDLYDHARAFLVAQLRRLNPRVSAAELVLAQAALERAISRVEVELPLAQSQLSTAPRSYRPTAHGSSIPRPAIQAKIDKTDIDGIFPRSRPYIADDGRLHQYLRPDQYSDRRGSQRQIEPAPTIEQGGEADTIEHQAFVRTIFIGIAVIVVMMAFAAIISIALLVSYIPRLLWLSEHLMDDPMLDNPMLPVMIAAALGLGLLFLPVSRKGGRRRSTISSWWRSMRLIARGT